MISIFVVVVETYYVDPMRLQSQRGYLHQFDVE